MRGHRSKAAMSTGASASDSESIGLQRPQLTDILECSIGTSEISTMAAEGMPVEVDTTKAQAFAGRLLTALNDAALCLMVSVGHRTGLFDVMSNHRRQPRKNWRRGRGSTNGTCANGLARWSRRE